MRILTESEYRAKGAPEQATTVGVDIGVVLVQLLLVRQAEVVAPLLAFSVGALLYVARGKTRARPRNHTPE